MTIALCGPTERAHACLCVQQVKAMSWFFVFLSEHSQTKQMRTHVSMYYYINDMLMINLLFNAYACRRHINLVHCAGLLYLWCYRIDTRRFTVLGHLENSTRKPQRGKSLIALARTNSRPLSIMREHAQLRRSRSTPHQSLSRTLSMPT